LFDSLSFDSSHVISTSLPTRAKANSGDRRRTRNIGKEEENGKQCEEFSDSSFAFFEKTDDDAVVATMALVAVTAMYLQRTSRRKPSP
jgi:hypothetical protein